MNTAACVTEHFSVYIKLLLNPSKQHISAISHCNQSNNVSFHESSTSSFLKVLSETPGAAAWLHHLQLPPSPPGPPLSYSQVYHLSSKRMATNASLTSAASFFPFCRTESWITSSWDGYVAEQDCKTSPDIAGIKMSWKWEPLCLLDESISKWQIKGLGKKTWRTRQEKIIYCWISGILPSIRPGNRFV